ncbi:hypothetical protein M0804_002984 [Polistes exclamans]|nr:hypothetical protein M0804_002984 [Polistes exclamans]
MNSESYEEQIDPIAILRKEIQDWRDHKEINSMEEVYTTSDRENDSSESQNENVYSIDDDDEDDDNNDVTMRVELNKEKQKNFWDDPIH